jgi:hypothetical protein
MVAPIRGGPGLGTRGGWGVEADRAVARNRYLLSKFRGFARQILSNQQGPENFGRPIFSKSEFLMTDPTPSRLPEATHIRVVTGWPE